MNFIKPNYASTDPKPFKKTMKRFNGIMRDTWWVWLVLVGGGTIAGVTVSRIFLSAIPISFFAFCYFAMMRYDENGDAKIDL